MIFHCPKCGEVCRELIFDFRDHIIGCDVCEKRQTRFKLEEEQGIHDNEDINQRHEP